MQSRKAICTHLPLSWDNGRGTRGCVLNSPSNLKRSNSMFVLNKPMEPESVEPTPVADTPPAEFVPKQQFEDLMTKVDTLTTNVSNYIMAQTAAQAAPARTVPQVSQYVAPAIDDVSDADYERAVKEGGEGAAAIIAKRTNAQILRAQIPLQQQLHTLQTQGIASIARLTRTQLNAREHYSLLQKEIDAALDEVDPSLQTNPEVLDFVYNQVVGKNAQKIIDAKIQEAIRKQNETPAEEPASRGRMKSSTGEEIPTFEEALGSDAMDALESRYGSRGGRAQEAFVQSMGYKDWETYYEKVIKPYGH